MKQLRKIATGLLLACAHAMACAGSPGGLQIVIVGTAKALPHGVALDAFFARYNADNNDADCDNSQLNIDSVYRKAAQAGVTPDLALAATSDRKQRKRLGGLLGRFRDKNHPRGFDGALAYDLRDDKILLYGISAMPEIKIYASVLPMADLRDIKKINMAICHALVHLPVLEEP